MGFAASAVKKDPQTSRAAWQFPVKETGGDERARTADLLVANQALSQLSYIPKPDRHLGQLCREEA